MYLSIIVPAYNEEKRIGATLSRIYSFLSEKDYSFEVILVDDGSMDGTVSKAEHSTLARKGCLKVIRNGVNKGKGFSVRSGILNSSGEFIIFSDADLSTPIEELSKLFDKIKDGYDIVIASRALDDSDVGIHQPFYREKMGKVFNFFVKLILLKDFNDTQCGFKLFKGDIARMLAKDMKIDGFCFDVEMLYLAKKKGLKIKEVGVRWENSPESKVKALSSSVSMFFDLFRIRALH